MTLRGKTPARLHLADVEAMWAKGAPLNAGEIAFLIRLAGAAVGEPRAMATEDIAWAREVRDRWLKVRPNAVCGGSDAQAINVFTEALSDLLSLTAIVSAAASVGTPTPSLQPPTADVELTDGERS